jgi:hypothetical protein
LPDQILVPIISHIVFVVVLGAAKPPAQIVPELDSDPRQ